MVEVEGEARSSCTVFSVRRSMGPPPDVDLASMREGSRTSSRQARNDAAIFPSAGNQEGSRRASSPRPSIPPQAKELDMTIPYASATSGMKAREEITKVLRRLGCEEIGFADNFEKQEVLHTSSIAIRKCISKRQPKAGRRCGSRRIPG